METRNLACAAVVTLSLVGTANASTIDFIKTNDDYYGSHSLTVDQSANISTSRAYVGDVATYNTWMKIDFVDAAGYVAYSLSTMPTGRAYAYDAWYFGWNSSQYSDIGKLAADVVDTGAFLSYTPGITQNIESTIASLNGGQGIYHGYQDPSYSYFDVTLETSVPEPATISLLFAGILGFGGVRKKTAFRKE